MSTNFPPVVVGIKDKQPTALRYALHAAARIGTQLRVLHSATVPMVAPELGPELLVVLREEGQAVLDDARHFVEQEVTTVPVEYELSTEGPVEALTTSALASSLLVIGADDLSWPNRLLGGAVASHIALHASSPVVVVPERAYPTPLSGGVVIALDGDTPAKGPLKFAFEQADAGDGALHVLHAVPPGTSRPDTESIRANIGEVLAGWSETYPNVRMLLSFPIDEADDACARATERSELVVVGRPHRHALAFALARPLATEVLRHAHCPVAVVPADYRGAAVVKRRVAAEES